MPTLYFAAVVFFLLSFSSPILSGRRLPYFHTWCDLRANLECRSEMCCTRLAENTGRKHYAKIAVCAPSHNFVGYIFATKGCIDNRKKPVKQQYILQRSPQYGELELRPISSWDRLTSLGTPSSFQRVSLYSCFRYYSDVAHRRPTKLCTMFGRLLGWYAIRIYIFMASCPITEFCQVQNSLCVQVLRSPLPALLHGTPAAGSAKLSGMV